MGEYDTPLDLPHTDADGGVLLVTNSPDLFISMLHDMGHYLTEDGFEDFMKWLEARNPEAHARFKANGHNYREPCMSNMRSLVHQIHVLAGIDDGETSSSV